MDQKVCLDTDVCIAIVRQQGPYKEILRKAFSLRAYIMAITLFELLLRETNIYQIENFIKDLELLSFDSMAARKASDIQKELKAKGRIIDIRDLFIASTSIVNNCILATLNKKHFENIKGLKLLDF